MVQLLISITSVNVIIGALDAQLKRHSVEYMQFSFRWINNLLTREFPLHCVIRLWDTYLVRIEHYFWYSSIYLNRLKFRTFLISTCMFVLQYCSSSLKIFSHVMTFK